MGTLVTLDPVSLGTPNYDKVTANSGTWINVNANPDEAKRCAESGWGNAAAGFGSSWDDAPKGRVTQHYNANINQAGIYNLLIN